MTTPTPDVEDASYQVLLRPATNGDEAIEMKETKPHYQATESVPEKTRKVLRNGPMSHVNNCFTFIEESIVTFVKNNKKPFKLVLAFVLTVLYIAYFVVAVNIDFERARNLVYVTAFAAFCFLYWLIKKYCGRSIWKNCMKPIQKFVLKRWTFFKWSVIVLFFVLVIVWLVIDTRKDTRRLISLVGLLVYIFIGFLFSKQRDQVNWRPVIWGFALQFIFGLLILRTNAGYQLFKWLGDRVSVFMSFSSSGIEFVFKPLHLQNSFAISILPITVYFSACTYLAYYSGIMQILIKKIAWLLQITMGTSPAESVSTAGNIFVGQTEAPLLIRPFLEGMTDSEMHAVMTGGFATIAGSIMAAYICFGVSASHLLSASVMSAPAALAMSKLMYPEMEETEFKHVDEIEIEKTEEKNVFEALSVGASMSIALIANIAVMLIAFISILALFNGVLSWFGSMIDRPDLTFEFILSYVFMPFAYIMGVDWSDSFLVAELLGIKTFINEFVAYERLGKIIENRVRELGGEKMSIRSEVICTYALCGFANFGSMGVQIGGISVLAPSKRPMLSRLVLRALVAGTLACFMTACVAGVLYDESNYDTKFSKNTTSIC